MSLVLSDATMMVLHVAARVHRVTPQDLATRLILAHGREIGLQQLADAAEQAGGALPRISSYRGEPPPAPRGAPSRSTISGRAGCCVILDEHGWPGALTPVEGAPSTASRSPSPAAQGRIPADGAGDPDDYSAELPFDRARCLRPRCRGDP